MTRPPPLAPETTTHNSIKKKSPSFRPLSLRSSPSPETPTTPKSPRTPASPTGSTIPATPRAAPSVADALALDVPTLPAVHLRHGALPQAHEGWVTYASWTEGTPLSRLRPKRKLYMRLRNRTLLLHRSKDTPAHENAYRVIPLRSATVTFTSRETDFALVVPLSPPHTGCKHLGFRVEREEVEVWVDKIRKACGVSAEEVYEFGRRLGRGAFGEVRVARDRASGEKFAVKVIVKKLASARQRQLLSREVRALCAVEHKNVVQTVDVFDESGRLCVVSEYVDGGELCQLYDGLDEGMVFPEELAQNLSRQIVEGVMHLHSLGIVHRDLKPENILCQGGTWPPTIKLTDFGLANFLEEEGDACVLNSVVGSPVFVAPEMVTRKGYTTQVDMWSVGVLVYQMLSGSVPFGISNFQEYMSFLQRGAEFKEPAWKSVSTSARSFVKAILQVNPDRRLTPLGALQHEWLATSKGKNIRYDEGCATSRRLMERRTSRPVNVVKSGSEIAKPLEGAAKARAAVKRVVGVIVMMQRISKLATMSKDPEALARAERLEIQHLQAWINRLAEKVHQRQGTVQPKP